MGLKEVKRIYAMSYAQKNQKSGDEPEKNLKKSNATVPVGQHRNNETKPIAGAELEHEEKGVYLDTANTLTNKDAVKKAESDARVAYQYAKDDKNLNWTDKDIAKFAKGHVKNQVNGETFKQTYVCYDKDEYKKLSAQREEEFAKLVKQFRSEGLSRKDAKKKADSMLYKYTYLKKGALGLGGRPRKFVENNKELFFENGKFSNEKYHEFVLNMANTINADNKRAKAMGFTDINGGIATEDYNDYLATAKEKYTNGDEAKAKELLKDMGITDNGKQAQETNYELHLKESRDVLAPKLNNVDGINVSAGALRSVARKAGMKTERDNSIVYKALGAAAMGGLGHYLIPGISVKSVSGSSSDAIANAVGGEAYAGSTADAVAGAAASVKVNPGSILGVLGLALSDHGKKVKGVPRLTEEKKQEVETICEDNCPIKKIDEKEEIEKAKETCGMDIKKGQTLYDAARDALGNTVIIKGKIADRNPAQTKRLTNYVKASYGLKPKDAPVGRTHFEFPLEFEGKEVNCKATIHGTNVTEPKTVKGNVNNGNFNPEKEIIVNEKHGLEDCNKNRKYFKSAAERDAEYDKLTK